MLCGWISIQDDVAAGLYSFDANEDDGEASIWRPADPRDEAEVCYSAPDRGAEYCDERVCVCLSFRDHIFGIARPIFTNFLCVLPMAVARSSSGGVVIRYVLPVYG